MVCLHCLYPRSHFRGSLCIELVAGLLPAADVVHGVVHESREQEEPSRHVEGNVVAASHVHQVACDGCAEQCPRALEQEEEAEAVGELLQTEVFHDQDGP